MYAAPSAVTLQEVKDATAAAETVQNLVKVITTQRWHEVGKDVTQYHQNQMAERDLRGTCKVPKTLQQGVLC